jgi:O-antigen/teichoic acid export membrane protein
MTATETKIPFLKDSVRLFQSFNIVRQVAVILGSILLAKSVLSVTEIGKFESLLYLGQIISVFWVNGLNQAFLSIFPKVGVKQRNTFVSTVFILFLVTSLAFSLILVLARKILLPFLIETNYIDGLYWYALYSFANVPAVLIPSILLLRDNAKEMIRFTVLYFIGYVSVFIINLWLQGNLIHLLIMLNVFAFLMLFISGRISLHRDSLFISKKWMKRLLLIGSPLIGYSILAGLAPLFDNWLVQRLYEDKAMFAIYRYGAREFPLTMTLAIGLGTSMIPAISHDLTVGLRQLKKRALRLYPVIFICAGLLIVSSKVLFPVIFNESFEASAPIFNIYLLIIISRMIFSHSILLGMNQTRILLYISLIELLINVVCSLLLGLKFGLIGIAAGTFIAFAAEKIIQAVYLKQKHQIRFGEYTPVRHFVLYSLALIVLFVIWGI